MVVLLTTPAVSVLPVNPLRLIHTVTPAQADIRLLAPTVIRQQSLGPAPAAQPLVSATSVRLTRTAIPARADIRLLAPAVIRQLPLKPALAGLNPVPVTSVRLTRTAIPARADIQPPPADVLMVIPPRARPAPVVPDPAPVTSVMLVVPIPVQARGILLPNPAIRHVQQQLFAEKLVTIIAK